MWMLHWLIWLPLVAEGVRVADEVANAAGNVAALIPRAERVEGKVIRCSVGSTVVFEKAEDESAFPASLVYVAGEGTGAIDIPGIIKIEVKSQDWVAAQLGHWFVPPSYYLFPGDIDSSGTAITQDLLSDNANWIKRVRITRGARTIKVFAERLKTKPSKQKHIEIEFTGATSAVDVDERLNLAAQFYYMPMQGNIISLKVDGKMVFHQAYTTSKFPVVWTPANFPVSNWQRGLDVNVVGFTLFWVWKNEMEKKGHFSPNSHGYSSLPTNPDPIFLEMWNGFKKWEHYQTADGIVIDQELTIKTNANTVEISGNGAELVFSRDKVEGKLIKCHVGDRILFEKVEQDSAFKASWEYSNAAIPTGTIGEFKPAWVISIPGIVKFMIDLDSLMASPVGDANFVPKFTTQFPDQQVDPSGAEMKRMWTEEVNDVHRVSIRWASHKTIKLSVQVGVRSGSEKTVQIEFTRGPETANAAHYDMGPPGAGNDHINV